MKKILNNKFILIFFTIFILIFISIFNSAFGSEKYQTVDFEYGTVTASNLNVRRGPGISFQAVGLLKKGDYIRILGKIGNWYVVQTEKDIIGTVFSDYVKPYTDFTEEPMQEEQSETTTTSSEISKAALDTPLENYTQDELDFLEKINAERRNYNIPELQIDSELQNVARLKANDLVNNNYFSHTSPTYGTLYNMLDSNNIKYKTASENIAGNSNLDGAIKALMNSDSHKSNILSTNYNYTGIAVVNSNIYGKIFVQLFIGN